MRFNHRLSIRPTAILTRATILKIGQSVDASQVIFGQYELSPAPPVTAPGAAAAPAVDPNAALHGTLRLTGYVIDLKHMRLGPTFNAEGSHYLSPKLSIKEAESMRTRPPVRG